MRLQEGMSWKLQMLSLRPHLYSTVQLYMPGLIGMIIKMLETIDLIKFKKNFKKLLRRLIPVSAWLQNGHHDG